MQEQVNLQDVIEYQALQIKQLSTDCAYNAALAKSKNAKIEELQQQLDKLKKEHVQKLDKEA